jgi:hypothetical protein
MVGMISDISLSLKSVQHEIYLIRAPEPTPTPATVGKESLQAVQGGRDSTLESSDGASVLSEEQQQYVIDNCDVEYKLVRYMTPHFKDIFHEQGLCVINSEDHAWIKTKGADQKPDIFLAPLWAYEVRKPKGERRLGEDESFRFGVLADNRLRDCVYILDAKLKCTPGALGELIIHSQHLAMNRGVYCAGRAMLFGSTEFWLIETRGIHMISRMVGQWTTPGSVECIRSFFTQLTWHAVPSLFTDYHVVDPHLNKHCDTSFLGAGGFGRVIAVVASEREQVNARSADLLALKVVEESIENSCKLNNELVRMKEHHDKCQCGLIAHPVTEIHSCNGLLGYVLEPVGQTRVTIESAFVNHDKADDGIMRIVTALYRLHTHSPPIFHNDPRIHNLMRKVKDWWALFWIDMGDARVGGESSSFYCYDMTVLCKSLLPLYTSEPDLSCFEPLRTAIGKYSNTRNDETIANIVSQIWLQGHVADGSVFEEHK